jgi:3-oxoacyl-(acyl-carrier-protein) synthase
MILSEGAGAVLLARHGSIKIDKTHPAGDYRNRSEAGKLLKVVLSDLAAGDSDFIIASANGTFVDQAEADALAQFAPDVATYSVKPALGESVGAGGLWQVIVAAQALHTGVLPPLLHAPDELPFATTASATGTSAASRAIAISCGLSQQLAAVRLVKNSESTPLTPR